jgi:two-component system, cell cycle sensor histidine kinase and response regulator CckA
MKDRNAEKELILKEVAELRQRTSELEKSEAEHQLADEALRESEERYKALIETTSTGYVILDMQGRVTDANMEYVRLTGHQSLDDIIGKNVLDWTAEYDITRNAEEVKKCLEKGCVKALEIDYKNKNGQVIPVEINATVLKKGKTVNILTLCRDITERRHAEQALKASEEKYRLLFENATDAIFVAQDEMLKFPNPQLTRLLGYSYEELTSTPFRNFIHPEDSAMVAKRHRSRLQGHDVPTVYSFRAVTKSGEILWVEVNKVLITWEGRPATLSFLRDITHQKKIEEQLLQAQKMEAIGQLAGGIAHDFNNLLTAIIGYGHLLKNDARHDVAMSAYVGHILTAADRAAILTNDLLTFSRKQIMNPQPVNLNMIIKNMESLLSRVIGEDIELSTVLTDADLTILADSTQIDQILMNLATNAQDAMPKGGRLTIRTDRMELDGEYIQAYGYGKPGLYALLSVEDTGTGMDKRTKERIFEPFFTTKEVGKGTGLGLSMVYGIIKQHDGDINVYSEPGRGTTFRMLLPLIQSKVEEIKHGNPLKVKSGTETILIAEDDAQVRNLLKEILSKAGYHVNEVSDGSEAVEVFHKKSDDINLLILDVIMPKMNGKETYKKIIKLRPDIKVIFISGYNPDVIHKKGMLEVGLNFISKPVAPGELLTKVREVLDT